MKVGFVLDDSLDTTDGVQQYILNLGLWMTRKGIEVHYLCGSSNRQDIDRLHSLASKIPVRFNKNKLTIPLPSSSRSIRKVLIREKFDVLHIQMPYSPMLAARIIQLSPPRTAIIGTFHIAPFSKLHKFSTWALGYVLRPNLGLFDSVISVSSAAQQTAKSTFNIDSKIIPNVVDYSRLNISKNKPADQKDIVFLGRLVKRKGCLELVKAYEYLLQNQKNMIVPNLVIAGDGPDRAKIEKYITNNKLTKHIQLLGRVTEEEKAKLLSGAKIAVFPSIGGESFGIVLIEAMACGSGVVLGGDNPGYSEVLQKKDYLFNPKNVKLFASKLEEFINRDLASDHKFQYELMKKFDVDIVAPKILDEYNSVIAKKVHTSHNVL